MSRTRRPRPPPRSLRARARRAGLLLAFTDAGGRVRTAPPATVRRLLRSLEGGAPPSPPVPPPQLVWVDGRRPPRLRLAAGWRPRPGEPVRLCLNGRGRRLRLAFDGRAGALLGRAVPFGVHRLEVGLGPRLRARTVVIAPRRLGGDRGRREWGVFVPVYALRDARTWGCGDLRAFREVGRWAARRGARLLLTLPLLPAFLDRPYEPSPYRPVGRAGWNEVYLAPASTPEFRRSPAAHRLVRSATFRREVARLESRRAVDFRAVARLKRSVVERMLADFRRAPASRRRRFERFLAHTPGVRAYATFRARGARRPGPAARYHAFVQWLVAEQLDSVARDLARRGVALGFDLPLGVHPRGAEVDASPELFARDVRVGSPPDPGVPRGQDWGFPPWIPERLRAAGYRPFAEALAHQLGVAPWLRVDHILGWHRLFWIPAGAPPRAGAYVREAARERYAVALAEAARVGGTLVGEDLGTVPLALRPTLHRHGILALYVAELEWDGLGTPRPIPRGSVAMLNTHDHLPFAGYWAERSRRIPAPSGRGRNGFPPSSTPERAAFRLATERLAASRACMVVVNVEDLWGEREPQNVPGVGGRQFARRCRRTLAQWRRDPFVTELLTTFDGLRRG